MTKEGFVGYFYGASVDPDVLALAMQRARCSYGVHLDMNAGHTGLEFYRVAPEGHAARDRTQPLDDVWEARGTVPGMPGWEFMARRMIKFMALMNFPRYIEHRAARLFLPDAAPHPAGRAGRPRVLNPAEAGEGAWRIAGLAAARLAARHRHHEPAPRRRTRPVTRVGLIKLDPKFVRMERLGDVAPKVVIEFRSVASDTPFSLWHTRRCGFTIGNEPPGPGAMRVTSGFALDSAGSSAGSGGARHRSRRHAGLRARHRGAGPRTRRGSVERRARSHRLRAEAPAVTPARGGGWGGAAGRQTRRPSRRERVGHAPSTARSGRPRSIRPRGRTERPAHFSRHAGRLAEALGSAPAKARSLQVASGAKAYTI